MLKCVCKRYSKLLICVMVSLIISVNLCSLTYSEEVTPEAVSEANEVNVQAEAVLLMEASTGTVIYEKDSDRQMPPASITKIMTLILIFDALDSGKIKLDEMVTTSEYAASMGGSQVFLEAMEQQTVDTLIKCIAVASANDACVACRDSRQCPKPL